MFFEILVAVFLGSCFGIITGITPGVHINMVAAVLLTLMPVLATYINPVFIAVAIVAMSIVHTFLDAIPSTFLGAPDEEKAMMALPGHVLLLQGRGFEAVKLATIGSFLGLVAAIILIPVVLVAVPHIFSNLQKFIGVILLIVVCFMILKEEGIKKFWSFFVFTLSGILGIIVFSMNIKEPLFPMLCERKSPT